MLRAKIQPYLLKLANREITNREVAHILGASEAYVSRMLASLGVKKAPRPPDPAKNLKQTRKAHRLALLAKYPIAQAAIHANCSERTLYRLKNAQKPESQAQG